MGSLGTSILTLRANIQQFQSSMATAQQTMADFNKAAQGAALAAGAAFAGLAIPLKSAIDTFASFEAEMNKIAAVSGATKAELGQLTETALRLGAQTQFSAREAAAGMAELAKSGFNAQQTMAAIPGVLSLAAAGGTSVARAAEISAGALRGFGLDVSQAGRVADLLAQSANQSAVDISDLGTSLKYVAPVAHASGQSIEEMSSALSILGNNMIKGSQAGTTLRQLMERFADPPKKAGEELARLGVSLVDVKGNMLPLSDVIDQLREKTAKMTNAQQQASLAHIAGTEAMSGLAAMVKTSVADWDKMKASMNGATGAADEMAKKMNAGLGAALEQMRGAVETLAIKLGGELAPAVREVAGWIQKVAEAVSTFDPAVLKAAVALGSGAAAALGLVAAMGALGYALEGAAALAAVLSLGMGSLYAAVAVVAVGVGALVAMTGQHQDSSIDLAHSLGDQADSVTSLAAEYDILKEKAELTTEEKERLRQIIQKLIAISPSLASGYNSQGVAVDILRGKVDELAASFHNQAAEAMAAARASANALRMKAAEARVERANAVADYSKAVKDQKSFQETRSRGGDFGNVRSEDVEQRVRDAGSRVKQSVGTEQETLKVYQDADRAINTRNYHEQFGPAAPKVQRGGAYHPTAKHHAGRHSGGAKHPKDPQVAADQQEFQHEKAMAEAKKQLDEASAAQRTSIERARVDQHLSLLKAEFDQGKRGMEEYLRAVEKDQLAQVEIETQGRTIKLDLDAKAIQAEIDAADKAAKDLLGRDTAKAQAMVNKSEEFSAKIEVVNKQRETAVIEGEQKKAAVIASTNAQILLENKKIAEELANIERKARQESEFTLREVAAEKMDHFGKMEELARLAADKERAAAQETYRSEVMALQAKHLTEAQLAEAEDALRSRRDAALALSAQKEVRAQEEIATAWKKALADIGGALSDLASSPSLDKFLSLGRDLVLDPQKAKEWASAIKEGAGALRDGLALLSDLPALGAKLAGAWSEAAKWIGEIATTLGPAGLAAAGVLTALAGVGGLINANSQNAKSSLSGVDQALKDLGASLKVIEEQASAGLFPNEAEHAKAMAEAHRKAADDVKKAWEEAYARMTSEEWGEQFKRFWSNIVTGGQYDAAERARIEAGKRSEVQQREFANSEDYQAGRSEFDRQLNDNEVIPGEKATDPTKKRYDLLKARYLELQKALREGGESAPRLAIQAEIEQRRGELESQAGAVSEAAYSEMRRRHEEGLADIQERKKEAIQAGEDTAEAEKNAAKETYDFQKSHLKELQNFRQTISLEIDGATFVRSGKEEGELERVTAAYRSAEKAAKDKEKAEEKAAKDKEKADVAATKSSEKRLRAQEKELSQDAALVEKMLTAQRAIDEATQRRDKALTELNSGGKGVAGEQVSLLTEAEVQVAKATAEARKRINELLTKEFDLKRQIRDIDKAEAEDIKKAMNEGVAQRAATEFKTKTDAVQGIKDKAQADRTSKQDELSTTHTQMSEEERAYNLEVARIRNEHAIKISALQKESTTEQTNINEARDRYALYASEVTTAGQVIINQTQSRWAAESKVTEQLQQQVNFLREAAQAKGNQASTGAGGGASSPLSSVAAAAKALSIPVLTPLQKVIEANFTGLKFHGGGVVPGPAGAEVRATLRAGERVRTEEQEAQVQNLIRWATSAGPGWSGGPAGMARGGGGTSINLSGGITINMQGSYSDPRAFARDASREIGVSLRQLGHRRI